jgi:hypothetical protein
LHTHFFFNFVHLIAVLISGHLLIGTVEQL